MFSVGDKIVYGENGVCVVEKIAPLDPVFPKPEFSTDNAMGVAVLAHRMIQE